MGFDAPGSEKVFWTNLLVYSVVFFPLICIISAIGLIVIRRNYEVRRGRVLALAPIFDIFLVVVAFTGSSVFCNGNLSCRG